MHELSSYANTTKVLLLLLLLRLSLACQDKPISASTVAFSNGDSVTYSNLLSDVVSISAGSQACFSLLSSGSTNGSQKVTISISSFNKLYQLVNCYQTGNTVYDPQCVCSRGILSVTSTECGSCVTNRPSYNTSFCKSGDNAQSDINGLQTGSSCCNIGITVNPEYDICDMVDSGQIYLSMIVLIDNTTTNLVFNDVYQARAYISDNFNLTLSFTNVSPIPQSVYAKHLTTGVQFLVLKSLVNSKGEFSGSKAGLVQRVNGVIITPKFALQERTSIVALTCPLFGPGTFSTDFKAIGMDQFLPKTRTFGYNVPVSQGIYGGVTDSFYAGLNDEGEFIMSDYETSDNLTVGGSISFRDFLTSDQYVNDVIYGSTCHIMCPLTIFFGLSYKPCVARCPSTRAVVLCNNQHLSDPNWNNQFSEAIAGPNGLQVVRFNCISPYYHDALNANYTWVNNPSINPNVNQQLVTGPIGSIYRNPTTRSVTDRPPSFSVAVTGEAILSISTYITLSFNKPVNYVPVIKSVQYGSTPYVEAYLRDGEASCRIISTQVLFSPFTTSLDTTPKKIFFPLAVKTYSGNDTLVVNCGLHSDSYPIVVRATDGESIETSVSYSPFNLGTASNTTTSFAVKVTLIAVSCVLSLLILYFLYRIANSRSYKPIKIIRKKRIY